MVRDVPADQETKSRANGEFGSEAAARRCRNFVNSIIMILRRSKNRSQRTKSKPSEQFVVHALNFSVLLSTAILYQTIRGNTKLARVSACVCLCNNVTFCGQQIHS